MRKCLLLLSLSLSLVVVGVLRERGWPAPTPSPQAAPTFLTCGHRCASGCSLLTGPFTTASTASVSSSSLAAASRKPQPRCPVDAMPGPTTGSLAPGSVAFGRRQPARHPPGDPHGSSASHWVPEPWIQPQHLGRRASPSSRA